MARVPAGYYLPEGAEPEPKTPRKKSARKAPAKPLEAAVQVAIVRYLRLALPGAVIHASPNGAHLAGEKQGRAIAMAKLKSAGMLVGWPDLIVIWKDQGGVTHVWGFEVKPPKGGVISEAQEWVGERLEANGARWAVVRSVTDAENAIREWRGDIEA